MPLTRKLPRLAAALALLAFLWGGLFLNSHPLPPAAAQTTTDYDSDNNALIEITTLAQLNAIRWDLNGDGAVDDTANQTSYTAAFPSAAAGMGCPDTTADADTNPDPCAGYELKANLTFDTTGDGSVTSADSAGLYWNSGKGWTPVGSPENPYTGQFHGRGNAISHLFINRAAADNLAAVGLFGSIGKTGSVTGLGLINVSVTNSHQSAAGSIAGVNQGTITSSYATGSVAGSAVTGGLVGLNLFGTVQASFSAAAVSLVVGDAAAGGLVGQNLLGHIKASYASGSVSANAIKALAGGLVGVNQGSITASYARGPVTASGLGSVKGGLAAYDLGAETFSYWDTETTGITGGRGLGQPSSHLKAPTGYTGIYANWNIDLDGVAGGDNPWHFGHGRHYPILIYGDIKSAPQERDYDTDDNHRIEITTLEQLNAIRWDLNTDGVVAATDQANYAAAFPALTAGMGCPDGADADTTPDPCTGYELMLDLDFDTDGSGGIDAADGFHWNTGRGWSPIGSATAPFTGQFYGNDNAIANLYINQTQPARVGLFGEVSSTGLVDGVNLRAVNLRVQDGPRIGALAGVNAGTIKASSSTGRINAAVMSATIYAGGLVGSNTGSITASYAKVAVEGAASAAGGLAGHNGSAGRIIASYSHFSPILTSRNSAYLGGLVGHNQGAITAAYSLNPVKATGSTASVGGLVGYNQRVTSTSTTQGTITAAYALGPVVATGTTPSAGGLVGKNSSGTAANSYWATKTSGQSSSALGVGRTTQTLDGKSYTGDFANWNLNLDGVAGNDDPWHFRNGSLPRLKYGGLNLVEQTYLHIWFYTGDPAVLEEMQTSFPHTSDLTRKTGAGGFVWEVSDDGLANWTVVRGPGVGSNRRGALGSFLFVAAPSEANKRFRARVQSNERGWIYSHPTPPLRLWSGAISAVTFTSGYNPPRVGQQIVTGGPAGGGRWISCADTAGNGCSITRNPPLPSDQGRYIYTYGYYTAANGVRTMARSYIGPVQAAAPAPSS